MTAFTNLSYTRNSKVKCGRAFMTGNKMQSMFFIHLCADYCCILMGECDKQRREHTWVVTLIEIIINILSFVDKIKLGLHWRTL